MEAFKDEPRSVQQTRYLMDRHMVLSICISDLVSKQLGVAFAPRNLMIKVQLFFVSL
jgi:hypothetical protein